MLEVNKLSKSFTKKDGTSYGVLDNISFKLNQGEIVAIIGASGCGKTTLLKIIAGLDKADNGSIKSVVDRPSKHVGLMPQQAELMPWRNVLQNTLVSLEMIGDSVTDYARNKAIENLSSLGLGNVTHEDVSSLSGGMQQRVYLASLLTLNPKLYLLDEPLGQLDIPNRRKAGAKLKETIKSQKSSAIIVTHSIEEALFLADRILVLGGQPSQITHEFKVDKKATYEIIMDAMGANHV